MQREILFKGKRIDTKNWIYGYLLYVDSKPFIFELGTHINHSAHFGENGGFGILGSGDIPHIVGFEGNKTSRGWLCEIIPETICQYIGMKDRNGKQIFDGDIGKIKTNSGRVDTFLVKWGIHRRKMASGWEVDIPGFCFFIDNFSSFPIAVNYQNGHDLDIIEIIGSFHDNPELIQSL